MNSVQEYLQIYLKNKPMFLGMIRAKELELFKGNMKGQAFHKDVDKGGLRVLDFGCGDGFFCAAAFGHLHELPRIGKRIFTNGVEIVGLEVDKDAAEKAIGSGVYKRVVVYDGKKIPFADNCFDAIISNCVLEHVDNLELNIGELQRVLKPGGYFYTTVMTNKWEDYLFGALFLGNLYKKWMRKIQKHFNLLSANNWHTTFESAGFKVDNVVGYMDRRASRWIDFLHYISVGSLISYKLFGRWVLFPRQYDLIHVDKWLAALVKNNIPVKQAAALFFVLRKI